MTERIQITENQLELHKNLLSKDFATTVDGQQEIIGYVEGLRDELENKDGWKKVCELADQEREKPNDELVSTIVERTKPYIDITSSNPILISSLVKLFFSKKASSFSFK